MTKYVFIDDDGDKWELQNGRWVPPAYTSLRPKSTAELYNEYGGAPYIEVENWDDIPEFPEEPTELGSIYTDRFGTDFVLFTTDEQFPNRWINSKNCTAFSWRQINGK